MQVLALRRRNTERLLHQTIGLVSVPVRLPIVVVVVATAT
jgi:hypothetical protein